MTDNEEFQRKRSNSFITEDLTPLRQLISYRLRQDKQKIKKCWSIDGKIKCILQGQGDDKPISINTPYDLTKVGWQSSDVKKFIRENMLKNHDWNEIIIYTHADEHRLGRRYRRTTTTTTTTTTIPFSCTVCSTTTGHTNTTSNTGNNVDIQYLLSTSLDYIVNYSRLFTLSISKQICRNKDMQHKIQIIYNIRIKLRLILCKFRYFPTISYIFIFLKARNAQLYQLKSYLKQTYTLPKNTWQ